MAIAPNTIQDTFSRSASDGWGGTTDSGARWTTPSDSGFSISGGVGRCAVNANSESRLAYVDLSTAGVSKQSADEVLMRLSWAGGAAFPLTDFGPALSASDSQNYYFVSMQGNWSEMSLNVRIRGQIWELARTTAVTLVKDTQYWVRFRRSSTGLYVKVWTVGTTEPSAWTLTSKLWDGSYPPAAGSPGIHFRGTRDGHTVSVHDMYYFTQEEAVSTGTLSDAFNRTVIDGWGVANGQTWEGSVAYDPQAPKETAFAKSIEATNEGRGIITTDNTERTAIGEMRRTGDVEIYGNFLMGAAATGDGLISFGLRGTKFYTGGRADVRGFSIRIVTGTRSYGIWRRDSRGTHTVLGTGSGLATEVIQPNVRYSIRFQAKGSTMRSKVWRYGSAEPAAWQITASNTAYSVGSPFVAVHNSTTSLRSFYVYGLTYTTPDPDMPLEPTPEEPNPPPPPPKNYTTITENSLKAVTGSVTDTTMRLTASYTNDVDNNNIITPSWRQKGTSAWSTVVSSVSHNRTAKTYSFTITGLKRGVDYEVRLNFVDSGGVYGTNPLRTTVSTTALGIAAGQAKVISNDGRSIVIEATYGQDVDHNSTATLYSRESKQPVYVVEDYFVDATEMLALENYPSIRGGEWMRHSSTSQGVQSLFNLNSFYINATSRTDKALYYQTRAILSPSEVITGYFYFAELAGTTGVAARISPYDETYYGAGFDAEANQWEVFKMVSGNKIILETAEFSGEIDRVYKLVMGISGMNIHLYVDDVLTVEAFDDTLTDGYTGYYYHGGVEVGTRRNQITLRTFTASYRSPVGDWVSHGTMTPDRGLKKFTGTATPLQYDTVYEFKVQFSDTSPSASNTGTNPALVTAMTPGRASRLYSLGVKTTSQSAIVSALVHYDTNENSTLSFQYKSTVEDKWHTVSFQKVTKYRKNGKFDLTLAGLTPSTTYEVRVTVNDPDGIFDNSPQTLYGLFSTEGFSPPGSRAEKYYIWKIYDKRGRYLTTIHDAPIPEYSMHENGGTTDLELSLYRSFSEMSMDKIIDFQHRIDIWALDPTGTGLGPNLMPDADSGEGAWVVGQTAGTFGRNSSIDPTGGPDGGPAIKINSPDDKEWKTLSNPIHVAEEVPLVISCMARAKGGKLRLSVRSYNKADQGTDIDDFIETVGTDWQKLSIEYTPPRGTEYIRIMVYNDVRGTMWADKFDVRAKEMKVYSGHIESYTPKIDTEGETVSIQVLGLAAFLSDDYIEFMQFVTAQPAADLEHGRRNYGAADPADMVKMIIDYGRKSNPRFPLYYTSDSIKQTGTQMQYTFRDVQLRHALDKARDLCPAGWHYFIGPDGLVTLRGPQHATVHRLRIGVEISQFEVEKSIRNLKNYVRIKGRQDEDKSELGSEGSISYVAFDQASIDKYGKRMTVINDAQIIDKETARLVGDGRLEEQNKEEQRTECTVPDEKFIRHEAGVLRGYNIEAFLPGDAIVVIDPFSGPRYSFWNKMAWGKDNWNTSDVFHPVPDGVPIKTVRYKGDAVVLELSERPPSQVGDYAKFYRWMSMKDKE